MIVLISQRVLIDYFYCRWDPVSVREPSIEVAFFELLQEELNIVLKFFRVLDAAGGEVVIDILLGELLESELSHQAFSQRNFLRRVFLINLKKARRGQLVETDLALDLLMKHEAKQLLGLVMAAQEGLPKQGFNAGDVGGVN
jgi:hypothetical protein